MVEGGVSGRVVGGFELGERLGAGGFATVYRATQLSLNRLVAVKVLDPLVARNPMAARRFRREGEAAARLDHPAILPVYEAGEDDGVYFLAMRLVEGGTLAERLRSARLPPDQVAQLVGVLAAALDHAHARGVVHRDVKPANVLVEAERVWLADFGIAAVARTGGVYTTGVIGTAEYMAPEQARGVEVDGRADLYSLGCVAFECLAGRPPFSDTDRVSLLLKHATEPRPTTGEPALDRWVAKALEPDPTRRFPTGEEMATAFADAIGDRTPATARFAPTPPVGDTPTAPVAARRPRRPGPIVAAAAITVATAVAVAFIALGTRGRPSPTKVATRQPPTITSTTQAAPTTTVPPEVAPQPQLRGPALVHDPAGIHFALQQGFRITAEGTIGPDTTVVVGVGTDSLAFKTVSRLQQFGVVTPDQVVANFYPGATKPCPGLLEDARLGSLDAKLCHLPVAGEPVGTEQHDYLLLAHGHEWHIIIGWRLTEDQRNKLIESISFDP